MPFPPLSWILFSFSSSFHAKHRQTHELHYLVPGSAKGCGFKTAKFPPWCYGFLKSNQPVSADDASNSSCLGVYLQCLVFKKTNYLPMQIWIWLLLEGKRSCIYCVKRHFSRIAWTGLGSVREKFTALPQSCSFPPVWLHLLLSIYSGYVET